jgi:hypothetical protein
MRSLKGFGLTFSFRRIASVGLGLSFNELREDWEILMHELETDPDYEGILIPIKPGSPCSPNWAHVADAMAHIEAQNFSLAVDAASLVFAHSVLDDAVLQYCRVTAAASPSSWEQFVIEKNIKLSDARSDCYERLLEKKINEYINKLGKESLISKIQKLFEVCKPRPGFKPIKGFSYDKRRLEHLDELRHSIVHGSGVADKLPNGDDDIHFMQRCGLFLMLLVNHCFSTEIEV